MSDRATTNQAFTNAIRSLDLGPEYKPTPFEKIIDRYLESYLPEALATFAFTGTIGGLGAFFILYVIPTLPGVTITFTK